MRNKLSELCGESDKRVGEQKINVLSKLIRVMLYDLDITPQDLSEKLREFVKEHSPSTLRSYKAQARRRSSYFRTVTGPAITWMMFHRGLQLFDIKSYTFCFTYEFSDGVTGTLELGYGVPLRDLFERLLKARGVNDARLSLMADEWYDQPKQKEIMEKHRGRKPKGNLLRGLRSESLTWRFFMIGIEIVGVKNASFDLIITWSDNIKTMHSTDYDVLTGQPNWSR